MKKILITGASKGIGYETAVELAQLGNHVFAVARSKDKLEQLANHSGKEFITPIVADLTSDEGFKKVIRSFEDVPSIDVLINNAGALVNKPFMDTTPEDWNLQLNVNLLAPIKLIQSIKNKLIPGSHIVNISSMGGFQGASKFPGLSAYSSSKGALSILTECLSTEFEADKISVNCLCLGAVQTEMLNSAFPGYKAPTSAKEMAGFISGFALNAHNFINGKVLPISLNNPE